MDFLIAAKLTISTIGDSASDKNPCSSCAEAGIDCQRTSRLQIRFSKFSDIRSSRNSRVTSRRRAHSELSPHSSVASPNGGITKPQTPDLRPGSSSNIEEHASPNTIRKDTAAATTLFSLSYYNSNNSPIAYQQSPVPVPSYNTASENAARVVSDTELTSNNISNFSPIFRRPRQSLNLQPSSSLADLLDKRYHTAPQSTCLWPLSHDEAELVRYFFMVLVSWVRKWHMNF